MENVNLHDLGMFLDSEVYVLKDELASLLSKYPDESSQVQITDENLPTTTEDLDLIYEGNFEKGLLVIYETNYLESELREFLFNILGAVKYSLKDIALCSAQSIEEISQSKIDELAPTKILIFGKLNHKLSQIKHQDYEIKNEEGIEYLFANDLSSIFSNKEFKKLLWNKLKILFEVNH